MTQTRFPNSSETLYSQLLPTGVMLQVLPRKNAKLTTVFAAGKTGTVTAEPGLDLRVPETAICSSVLLSGEASCEEMLKRLLPLFQTDPREEAETTPELTVRRNLIKLLFRDSIIGTVSCGGKKPLRSIVVIGPVDPYETELLCRSLERENPTGAETIRYPADLPEVQSLYRKKVLAGSPHLFALGFKGDAPDTPKAALRDYLLSELAAAALCAPSSELYERLANCGLYCEPFRYEAVSTPAVSALTVFGSCEDPAHLRLLLLEEGLRLAAEGIPLPLLQRLKTALIGRYIMELQQPDRLAERLGTAALCGLDCFRSAEYIRSIQPEQLQSWFRTHFTEERCALSVVTSGIQNETERTPAT